MELLIGIFIGALMGSAAAAMMRVGTQRGLWLHTALGMLGAAAGGIALMALFPSPWGELEGDFLVWCVAGAAGLIGLATIANVLELALDLEAS